MEAILTRMRLESNISGSGIDAAFDDLRRDLSKVCDISSGLAEVLAEWTLSVSHTDSLAPETFVLEITPQKRVEIQAPDELGAIYAVYEFTHRYLGIDPYWFWKEVEPLPMDGFSPAPERIESGVPTFRYRGLFINDEDLLGRWKTPCGERFLDWPKREETLKTPSRIEQYFYENDLLLFYTPVVAEDTMEMVYEVLLRMRANLVIPASFTDIFNKPEADMIRAAVRRGLYVSQHHVEPLGVSHFAYESWWGRQGKAPAFSYMTDADSMRACWQAYAEEWYRVAGDRIIWQVGLRGRGDRPLWNHDPSAASHAGELISNALHDQMAIVRSVEARSDPLATLTLWFEGAELLQKGQLDIPKGVMQIFADHPKAQEMQEDFHAVKRREDVDYGLYYHVSVWPMGTHLVHGAPPEKIIRVVNDLVDRGDTAYAILNATNIREHVIGMDCWFDQIWHARRESASDFLECAVPPGTADAYRAFYDNILELMPHWRFYDGGASVFIKQLLRRHTFGIRMEPDTRQFEEHRREEFLQKLEASIAGMDALLASLKEKEAEIDPQYREFVHQNLVLQTHLLRGMYRCVLALMPEKADFAAAVDGIGEARTAMKEAETGRWVGWYRGDTKVNFDFITRYLMPLAEKAKQA